MRVPPKVGTAVAELVAALDVPGPRGPAVHAAARAAGAAAWAARYPLGDLATLLARALRHTVDERHPAELRDWLWARVLASATAAYADARAGARRWRRAPGRLNQPAGGAAAAGGPAVGALAGIGGHARVLRAGRAAPGGAAAGTPAPVVYRVDADDVITRVNAAWDVAAVADGAPALTDGVVGTSLWEHVSGAETRQLYAAVHAAVRRTGRAVVLAVRCDAPEERRWMHLAVRSAGRGQLEIRSTLVRREDRARVALLDAAAARGVDHVLMCSVCNRIRVRADGAWDEADRAGAAPTAVQPRLDHGVCRDCASEVDAALARIGA